MPSETEQAPAALNPDDLQVDIQKVLNSYARQVADMSGKIALLEASNETLQEENKRKDLEIEGFRNALAAKAQHNGRTTTPKGRKKK